MRFAKDKTLQTLSLVGELGYSISLPIVGGALIGRYFDDKFNSAPLLTLVLIFLGLSIGFYNVFKVIKKVREN